MTEYQSLDNASIDSVIKQFFLLFNNKASTPNLDNIYSLCIPEAIIIKKLGLDQTVYTLHSFIAPRKIILSDGTLTDFEEFEISNETVIVKNIAHRYCRYQKNGFMHGNKFSEQGTKLFHLVKTRADWKISSLVWEDDQ